MTCVRCPRVDRSVRRRHQRGNIVWLLPASGRTTRARSASLRVCSPPVGYSCGKAPTGMASWRAFCRATGGRPRTAHSSGHRRQFDPLSGLLTVETEWRGPAGVGARAYRLRLYTATRLAELLADVGLIVEQVFSGWTDRPLTRRAGEMLLVARKRSITGVWGLGFGVWERRASELLGSAALPRVLRFG